MNTLTFRLQSVSSRSGGLVAMLALLGALVGTQSSLAQAPGNPTKSAFLRLIDRPRVPLAPQVEARPDVGGLSFEHVTFASEAGERVPGILLKPVGGGGPWPVVVVLHGTGGKKEDQMALLKTLAGQGFLAIAPDGRYHGERSRTGTGATAYVEAILRTYRTGQGHPLLYDTVWDVLRLMDYLETRPDVDARRIGVIGFSKGGMETYLAAAVEPRIAVAVPAIGVQSFRWALEHNAWQPRAGTFQMALDSAAHDAGIAIDPAFVRSFYDRVVPGIYSQFDGPVMIPLISPRPLLVINGDSDARTPLPGLLECTTAAQQAYQRAGAEEKFGFYLQKGTGHAVTAPAQQAAIEWFVRWLKP